MSSEESLKRPSSEEMNANEMEQSKVLKTDPASSAPEVKTEGLSKSQLKKLKKKEYFFKTREIKRAKEKERLKQKKIAARLNNTSLGPSRKELKNSKMCDSLCKVNVVVDMSFDDLMDVRSLGKCNKQLLHCYSMNRRAAQPMQLHFTSLSGKSLEEMAKHDGYRNWDVHISNEHFSKLFPLEQLVYLSSESDNQVEELEENKVYIIGGLVDHNAHKGHCFEVAKRLGIGHAQLPIGQFLEMKTRRVLTIDHVFNILLSKSGGLSWKEAFLHVLPQRKGAKEKELTEDETSQDQPINAQNSNQETSETLKSEETV